MQNIIVTGGSRGLGLATARTLAAGGYRVIVLSRTGTPELEAAGKGAAESGRGAIEFRAVDLSLLDRIAPLVKALRAEFGSLYGLVNNAGAGGGGLLSTMRNVDIEHLIRLNTVSPIILTKYVVRSMMARREGRIVNVASIVATTGYSGLSVYGATKAALVGFTRSLAREVGQLGITVNAIAPGFIATEMTQDIDETQREKISRRSALKRMADPKDVARGVEFLLSEGARNITGTTLTIDAGNTA